jgi:adenine-specific DNA-methyltransferase
MEAKKKFLKLYKEKYFQLKKYLEEDKVFIRTIENLGFNINNYPSEFSKKLMIQLTFLYFLQKKLGLNKNIIRETFELSLRNKKNFFKDYLETMLYDIPNPFLKVRLFEPDKGYDWRKADIKIPNEIFSNIHSKGKEADGILDILDRFNFTLREEERTNGEMTIDPEILALIFENLLNVEDKRSKGVYYTPREIVRFMCQESLTHYLVKKVEVPYKDIKDFICNGRLNRNNDIEDKILKMDRALENIIVADLAVGSGAFPLGMLNAIVQTRNNITKYLSNRDGNQDRSLYNLKLNTIKRSIFAMDIDSKAVKVTKLRLWLSIISEHNSQVNVDMNIYGGNSLNHEFNGVNRGFDIIIGNPPYVGEKGNKEIFRDMAKTKFGEKYYQGKMDLFYFFFHRAIDLSKEGGIINFITTNYFTTANGATKLRFDIKNRTNILKLINFNEIKVFETAMGQHNLISLLEKDCSKDKPDTEIMTIGEQGEVSSYRCAHEKLFEGSQAYIRIIEGGDDRIESILDKISRGIKIEDICNVNQGIVSGADTLTNRHITRFGINGEKGEGIFVLEEDEIEQKYFEPDEVEILKPFFKNSDIYRYKSKEISDKRIIYIDRDIKNIDKRYPNIKRHLEKYYDILSQRRETRMGYIEFFHLHWGRKERIFMKEKIIAPQRSLLNTFAYNNIPWYSSADVYYITPKDEKVDLKYLLGILNSTLYYTWFYHRGKRKGEILELYQTPLKETPIIFSQERKKEIIDLVDQMLAEEDIRKKEIIQTNIDNIVYQIYDITEGEIKSISK